ncbi:hypothetical protein Pcinc_037787 [Petrolisthes cinctipes]|uniref:Uncharacterized protein n=1 Tax=Petrolisthes cinctipes TaxID=88211 RepID=A0AAE1EKQ7_PETCI|nr:hypothetical protein Pcinc_037787 [Petrolisthes cinctipes]
MDFDMDFDFPQDRWLFYQNIQNANGILEEHQRRRRIRRVVSDRMNPFVAMEDQEFIARFRLRKDTMHDLIQEIQDELLVTQDRKGVPIPPHLQKTWNIGVGLFTKCKLRLLRRTNTSASKNQGYQLSPAPIPCIESNMNTERKGNPLHGMGPGGPKEAH